MQIWQHSAVVNCKYLFKLAFLQFPNFLKITKIESLIPFNSGLFNLEIGRTPFAVRKFSGVLYPLSYCS